MQQCELCQDLFLEDDIEYHHYHDHPWYIYVCLKMHKCDKVIWTRELLCCCECKSTHNLLSCPDCCIYDVFYKNYNEKTDKLSKFLLDDPIFTTQVCKLCIKSHNLKSHQQLSIDEYLK